MGGGLFPANRSASVTVQGRLSILEWWNQPPTSPVDQPDQTVEALKLHVSAGGFGEVGALDSRHLFRGYDLSHRLMIVPPSSTLVFTMDANVSCGTGQDSGNAAADFASGAFQVGSPAVFVSVLS